MFYPDIHTGQHQCDTTLGPCPGPKPEDYLLVRRGEKGEPTWVTIVTHYINHGNTWQSATKLQKLYDWQKVGSTGVYDYLVLDEEFFSRLGKDKE